MIQPSWVRGKTFCSLRCWSLDSTELLNECIETYRDGVLSLVAALAGICYAALCELLANLQGCPS